MKGISDQITVVVADNKQPEASATVAASENNEAIEQLRAYVDTLDPDSFKSP